MAADETSADRPGRVASLLSRITAARRGRLVNARIAPSDVTIVVLNWNRAQDTISCLESLAAANLSGASVLVVDNGSRDRLQAPARPAQPDGAGDGAGRAGHQPAAPVLPQHHKAVTTQLVSEGAACPGFC